MSDAARGDQHEHWSGVYGRNPVIREHGSGCAAVCLARLARGSRVLELGCGTGADAATLAGAGHTVTATDFVEEAVAANQRRFAQIPNLNFQAMRTDEPFPFPDGTFDAVYAHLSLHYFTHDITMAIVAEIRRVLGEGGWLMFACKSPADPLYGKGVEIEPDMFDLNGHVRHFFSEQYARELLATAFTDIEIASRSGKLYGGASAWIAAFARAA
ncbi:MAG: class I SAM-dependent methyltransferase [Thermomicrobiales bacterium]